MKQTHILLLLVFTLLLGCSEPEDYSPVLRGTISGKVSLFNQYNEPESTEGATVLIAGERINMQATTDADGRYTIENVPQTDLVISVQKQGFKTGPRRELVFYTEKETVDLSMSRPPLGFVNQAAFYVHNGDGIRATVTLNEPIPVGKSFTLATFLGKTATVSDTVYLVKSINGFKSDGQASLPLISSISVEGLKNRYGFKTGDIAYIKVYTGAAHIYGYWQGDVYYYGPGLHTAVVNTYTVKIT